MGHRTSLPLQFPLWLWDALAAREASMRGLDLNSMTHYITLVGGFFWKFLVHTSLFCGHSLVSARTFGRDRTFGYFTTLRSSLPDLPAMLKKKILPKKYTSAFSLHPVLVLLSSAVSWLSHNLLLRVSLTLAKESEISAFCRGLP